MSAWSRVRWLLLGMASILLLEVGILLVAQINVATRPPMPPESPNLPCPWGAIDLASVQADANVGLQASLAESFNQESATEFDADGDGIPSYPLLALSGGGSNGAFGAGFMCGWTKAGTRPDFKVVTGVSAGALQSTLVFLGPEYDDTLREVFELGGDQIYTARGYLAALYNDALRDTSPLADVIRRYITEDLLAAVAEKHKRGYRLYVGTTNMDSREFIIWDMGAIAASGNPEALDRYRSILLASCSVPVLFPPVYISTEVDGETCYEMHADGGTYAQVFFRGFMLDFDDAFDHVERLAGGAEVSLYVIRNGNLVSGQYRANVPPRTVGIATATIDNLFRITIEAALYRMYVLANRYDIEFNLAYLPRDAAEELDAMEFNPDDMRRIFKVGYELAAAGFDWEHAPPGLDRDELFDHPESEDAPQATP